MTSERVGLETPNTTEDIGRAGSPWRPSLDEKGSQGIVK